MKKRMGQRVMAWVLAFVLLWVAIPAYPAVAAGGVTEDGLRWEEVIPGVGLAVITGYVGTSNTVRIPSFIGGVEVVGIAADAFRGRDLLEKVYIQAPSLFIGEHAFYNCGRLEVYWSRSTSDKYEIYYTAFEGTCAIMYYYPDTWDSAARDSFGGNPTVWVPREEGEEKVYESQYGQFTYRKHGDEITITRYTAFLPEAVVIPSMIEGCQVTKIGPAAFYGCVALSEVVVPYGVRIIQPAAFMRCRLLTQVTISQSVEQLEGRAFEECPQLSRVTFQNSPVAIGFRAFAECLSLKYIEIPNGATEIGASAFYKCTSLLHMDIPDSVKTIGDSAFEQCVSMQKVTLGQGIKTIPLHAFSHCGGLRSINIPNSVTGIDHYAFRACTSLTQIILPDSITAVGNGVFMECSQLRSVTLPSGLTKIPFGFFKSCTELRRITIPAGVTEIGEEAFNECNSLGRLVIPQKVENVGVKAFVRSAAVLEWEGLPHVADNLQGVTATVYYHPEKAPSDFAPETYSEGVTFVPFCKEHKWETTHTVDCEATCTADGEQSIHCVNGDARKDAEILPAVGHDFNKWIVTSHPSLHESGSQYRWCFTCQLKEVEEIPPQMLGDADGDSDITSTDARLVLQCTVQKFPEFDIPTEVVDVDKDGALTTTDARLILQYYAGKINEWP